MIERGPLPGSLIVTMKSTAFAIIALGMFISLSAFGGEKECCAHMTRNEVKGACAATFAKLDLTADQRASMEKLAADCEKGGCNKETMAKMEKAAQGVLSKEQFAAWKAACSGKVAEKTQS